MLDHLNWRQLKGGRGFFINHEVHIELYKNWVRALGIEADLVDRLPTMVILMWRYCSVSRMTVSPDACSSIWAIDLTLK